VEVFELSRSFIGGSSFFFISCPAISCLQPITSGWLSEEQRRRASDTVWRLKMKDI
jgi:hypothetical protein